MTLINLRKYYPWYTHDEFVEVPDEIAAELLADKRYQSAKERQMYRYKAQYSLDAGDGIETAVVVHSSDDPAALLERMETYCRLCQALNSLSEIQGHRIEACFLRGISRKEIAEMEGVSISTVSTSIRRGLAVMKKCLENSDSRSSFCPKVVSFPAITSGQSGPK